MSDQEYTEPQTPSERWVRECLSFANLQDAFFPDPKRANEAHEDKLERGARIAGLVKDMKRECF